MAPSPGQHQYYRLHLSVKTSDDICCLWKFVKISMFVVADSVGKVTLEM